MWGKCPRENNATYSALCHFSIASPTTHNQIGPFWCSFPGGWVCVHSRALWISPKNAPVRLGVSPTATSTSTSVFSQWLWGFISSGWNPGLHGQSHSPGVPPGLSTRECGTIRSASCCLALIHHCCLEKM